MADTLRIPCPMCQTMLKAPPEAAGKVVKCKSCGHKFTAGITAQQLAANRQASQPPPLPEPEPVPFDPDEEAAFGIVREPPPAAPAMGPTITYVCDQCGKYGQAPAHNAGMVFACGCGGVISVPNPAHFEPVDDAPRRQRRAASREEFEVYSERSRRADVAVLAWVLAVGGLLGLIYFLCMDTTVSSGAGGAFGFPDRVHNIGLMHQRSTGIMVSGGALVLGVILYALGPKR